MKYLRLAVREPPSQRNPMHTFLIEGDAARLAQLWNWSTAEGGDLLLFRVVGDLEPYAGALSDVAFIVDFETARIDEESFYVYVEYETRSADDGFREPFRDHRVLIMPPIEFDEDGETHVEIVGRAADVQAVVDGFPPAFEIRVDEIGSHDRGASAPAAALTDRQREAVGVAVDLGYFDVPRTASIEAVARELDCAPSTASDHLRKAQARLARRLVDD